MVYEQIRKQKKLTNLQRSRLNAIYRRLIVGQATKEELKQLINTKNERIVRDCISYIKKFYPVISLSGDKGYRIAKAKEDLKDAKHMIASETSRANEIMEGIVELKKFVCKIQEEMEALCGNN